ncbi:MAG: GerMN domain-containing protein, partial [Lachnospiraceae bacterium]|nr:GerMN domain-containing protein [Lachnospiraceae bacterium]
TRIVEQPCDLEGNNTTEMVQEMLSALDTDVDSAEYQKPLSGNVNIVSYRLDNAQLSLVFNEAYNKMDTAEEVLCRAAVVRTMVQIPGVDCVSFYIGDAPLVNKDGTVIGLMTQENFVENPGDQINSIRTARLQLYFANPEGDGLVLTEQEVEYSSNISKEKLIMENLLAGPTDKNVRATIPAGTKLVSVATTNGTCFVTLDSGFLNQNYEIQEAIVIYSIVNSLSEVSTVSRVQISINGETNGVYRNSFPLNQLYERNLSYVVNLENDNVINTEGGEALEIYP